jgi:hypothetical protein
VDLDALVEEGTIDPVDRDLVTYVETAEDAWTLIRDFYTDAEGNLVDAPVF